MSQKATNATSRIILWLPPLALMGLIFYLSSLTRDELQEKGLALEIWDKLQHSLAFLVLVLLLGQALSGQWLKAPNWRQALLAFLIAILFGMTDEIHQHFVPTREMQFLDWVADMVGSAGIFLWWIAGNKVRGMISINRP